MAEGRRRERTADVIARRVQDFLSVDEPPSTPGVTPLNQDFFRAQRMRQQREPSGRRQLGDQA